MKRAAKSSKANVKNQPDKTELSPRFHPIMKIENKEEQKSRT